MCKALCDDLFHDLRSSVVSSVPLDSPRMATGPYFRFPLHAHCTQARMLRGNSTHTQTQIRIHVHALAHGVMRKRERERERQRERKERKKERENERKRGERWRERDRERWENGSKDVRLHYLAAWLPSGEQMG